MVLAISTRYKKYEPVVLTDTYLVTFPIFATEDLRIVVDGAETDLYSVTATFVRGMSEDAAIVLNTAVTDVDVEIYGDRAPRRDTSYRDNAPDLAENFQRDADALTAVQQEQATNFLRAILLPASEATGYSLDLTAEQRASKYLGFDEDGNLLASLASPSGTPVSPFMETFLAVTTAPSALISLGLTSTAAELNILEGVTATATELNLLAGMTSLTAPTRDYLTSGTAATYTTPANARRLVVRGIGGGGGGGGVDGQSGTTAGIGVSGAAGGWFEHIITTPAASYTYTIGAAGAGGASGANNGTAGGATTFADGVSLSISAGGGGGGAGNTAGAGGGTSNGADGGATSGASLNIPGASSTGMKVTGGAVVNFSNGANSPFGAGGKVGAIGGAAGGAAGGYGAGGAGAIVTDVATNYAGGNGAPGLIIVEVYY